MIEHHLHRLKDGSIIDYGRNWLLFGKRGDGPARHYEGEAAEVMELLVKYSGGGK